MMIKRLVFTCSILFSASTFAFPCFITLVKDSCWKNYKISVMIIDEDTKKQVTMVEIPKNEFWGRQTFNCEPGQKLMSQAIYDPIFWDSEKGKIYTSKRFLALPTSIKPDDKAWNISVCFPNDFSSVPFPPDANGNCGCDFSKVPPVPAQ